MGERITSPGSLAEPSPVRFPGRIPVSAPLSGPWPDPSRAAFWGLRFSRRNCRPEHLVEAVLAHLLPHWGYENEHVVVAEVITPLSRPALGSTRAAPALSRRTLPAASS